MELSDINDQYFALDIGLPGSGWEPSPIYDTNTVFNIGGWTNPHIDIDTIIGNAIKRSDSPYSSYTPVTVVGFLFFNDASGSSHDYLDLVQFNDTVPIWPEIPLSSSDYDSDTNESINYPTLNLNLDSPTNMVLFGMLTILVLRVLSRRNRKITIT